MYVVLNLMRLLTHQKLWIRITKVQYDRIRNRLNLSFSVGAPRNGLSQDRIF